MAREGIYVGGHEIVERYVGSKLVWKKVQWILKIFRESVSATHYQNVVDVSFYTTLHDESLNTLKYNAYQRPLGFGRDNQVIEVKNIEWVVAEAGYASANIDAATGIKLICNNDEDARTLATIISQDRNLRFYHRK
nr:MAG TPA: hypothetical protein [Caudoviricetes sp.]